MARFTVNSYRFDPYRNFKFKIKWDNQYVAGLHKCSALQKTTEMTEWREAGDPSTGRKLPGKTTYAAITLEAGVTHDTAFEVWANLVNNFQVMRRCRSATFAKTSPSTFSISPARKCCPTTSIAAGWRNIMLFQNSMQLGTR